MALFSMNIFEFAWLVKHWKAVVIAFFVLGLLIGGLIGYNLSSIKWKKRIAKENENK